MSLPHQPALSSCYASHLATDLARKAGRNGGWAGARCSYTVSWRWSKCIRQRKRMSRKNNMWRKRRRSRKEWIRSEVEEEVAENKSRGRGVGPRPTVARDGLYERTTTISRVLEKFIWRCLLFRPTHRPTFGCDLWCNYVVRSALCGRVSTQFWSGLWRRLWWLVGLYSLHVGCRSKALMMNSEGSITISIGLCWLLRAMNIPMVGFPVWRGPTATIAVILEKN